jgi:glycosyltransferase involved in cell wall biosynthesis
MSGARKSKIVLLTANSLCHNPRALKEASALARAGHEVWVLGAWMAPALKERDLRLIETVPFAFVPVVDFTLLGIGNEVVRAARRVGKKAADFAFGVTGRSSSFQLGFGIRRFLSEALRLRADLYIAHSEFGLCVGRELLRRGRRVGVDMEDWFSEDLLPEARRWRPLRLLHMLERDLLARGSYASCPSHAMSAALVEEYGCKAPTVVYNAFAWADRQTIDGLRTDRRDHRIASICWYSQTLGPGRGLEDLVAAIPFLASKAEVHLRGRAAPGMEEWIRARVPEAWQQSIFFHPLVSNDELLSRVAEHDLGFAGEMKHSRSREVTVTNKILHYLLGGLPVVASDTAGQREVAAQAVGAVHLYPCGDPRALADAIDAFLQFPDRLRRAKAAALQAARQTFCWERQEPVLLQAIADAGYAMAPGPQAQSKA